MITCAQSLRAVLAAYSSKVRDDRLRKGMPNASRDCVKSFLVRTNGFKGLTDYVKRSGHNLGSKSPRRNPEPYEADFRGMIDFRFV